MPLGGSKRQIAMPWTITTGSKSQGFSKSKSWTKFWRSFAGMKVPYPSRGFANKRRRLAPSADGTGDRNSAQITIAWAFRILTIIGGILYGSGSGIRLNIALASYLNFRQRSNQKNLESTSD